MKKVILIVIPFLCFSISTIAQFKVGIKADANISSINSGGADYGSEIKSAFCPGIGLTLLTSGDNWGYFMDLGYAQSGWKEVFPDNSSYTVKLSNVDFNLIGVQYAFLDDWAMFRPIIVGKFGVRITFPTANIKTNNGTNTDLDVESMIDLPWSIGGGVWAKKNIILTLTYGGGLIDYINYDSGWKHKQFQLSASIYF